MLRSRLPVSASSTIVWRKETGNKSRILEKAGPHVRKKVKFISLRSTWHSNKRATDRTD